MPAIPFQGLFSGDGNREFAFDDVEYAKLPRVIAADFVAQDDFMAAELVLFTLNFRRQHPPEVDCSVTGFDADENPFSRSIQFGCWDWLTLGEISPEFAYPNLGLFANGDTHGWLQLNCRVDLNPAAADGFEADGGVHGAIIQFQAFETALPAGSGADFGSAAMWARLLYQSVTTGDAVTLVIEEDALGLD